MFGKKKKELEKARQEKEFEREMRQLFSYFIREKEIEDDGMIFREEKDSKKGLTHVLYTRDDKRIEFKKVKRPVDELFIFELDGDEVSNIDKTVEISMDHRRIPNSIKRVLNVLEGKELH